ncbi:hypothetical protein AKJ57_05335 [candidate division MSBL1 archaeon SCGC-AAA259A05]|uniref:Thiopeptide-type bacteriocin biosynthesis domain-containing protein n=1 Tax=candidate division MSBL1 archaeon SCGC-AAA259A05 TaxID=1698259 RepID=A0A133U5I5_9EURY|nr:hypothetical protein AKJ57_05335 [candidate division MSBL1 archaeon SCGC-AAA259A05]
MPERFEIVFETNGPEGDGQIIKEYIKPAVERLEDRGVLEAFHFFRYGGTVKLRLYGKRGEIEQEESSRWNELQEENVIQNWTSRDYSLETHKYGQRGAEMADSLFELASRASLLFLEEFGETKPDPVDTFSEERELPTGAWLFIHALFNQQSYGNRGEIRACLQAIHNRIVSTANNVGRDEANNIIRSIVQSMEELSDRLG